MIDVGDRLLCPPNDRNRMMLALIDENEQQRAEIAQLKQQMLQGVCVYCGAIENYESLEQKIGPVGNQMRIDHIKQCVERPELKLIAKVEELQQQIAEKDAILSSPDKWMRWCDHRVLEENEALKQQIAERDAEKKEDCGPIPGEWQHPYE